MRTFHLFIACTFILIISCKKDLHEFSLNDDSIKIEETLAKLKTPQERRFFGLDYLSSQNPYLRQIPQSRTAEEDSLVKSVLEYLLIENQSENFVPGLIDEVGYPVWDRSRVIVEENNPNSKVVLTPFSKVDEAKIDAYAMAFSSIDANSANWSFLIVNEQEIDTLIDDSNSCQIANLVWHVAQFIKFDEELFGYSHDIFKSWLRGCQAAPFFNSLVGSERCQVVTYVECHPYPFNGEIIFDRSGDCGDGYWSTSYTVWIGCGTNSPIGGGFWLGGNNGSGNGGSTGTGGGGGLNYFQTLSPEVQQIVTQCQDYLAGMEPGGTELPPGFNQSTACKCEQFMSIYNQAPLSSDHLQCLYDQAACEGITTTSLISNYANGTEVDADLISSFLNRTNCGQEGIGFKQFESLYNTVIFLRDELELNQVEVEWLLEPGNEEIVNEIFSFYNDFNATYGDEGTNSTITASNLFIDLLYANLLEGPYGEQFYGIINDYSDVDPALFAYAWAIEVAFLKAENPSWPNWKIGLYAFGSILLEDIHGVLDVAGLLPVAGEIADLTNGVIYTLEGEGLNAALSFSAAIPFAGWTATGAKFARKIILTSGKKRTLTWVVNSAGDIEFSHAGKLRDLMGLSDPALQAHHIIPWGKRNESAVQLAAKSGNFPFHINDPFANGIAIDAWRNQPNHSVYDTKVKDRLDYILSEYGSQGPDVVSQMLSTFQDYLRNQITSHSNLHLNDIPIMWP